MNKIYFILGYPCSGRKKLAKQMNMKHLHIDDRMKAEDAKEALREFMLDNIGKDIVVTGFFPTPEYRKALFSVVTPFYVKVAVCMKKSKTECLNEYAKRYKGLAKSKSNAKNAVFIEFFRYLRIIPPLTGEFNIIKTEDEIVL